MWTLDRPVAPCPFCGSGTIVALHVAGSIGLLQCTTCQAQGPIGQTEAAAVQAWQARGPLQPRACPQCGTLFQPRTVRHLYDSVECRVAALRDVRIQERQSQARAQRQIEQERQREEARRRLQEKRAAQEREKIQAAWALASS